MDEINDKVNDIKEHFQLKSIDYSNDWSVSQFRTCLKTLNMYADKWHEKLRGIFLSTTGNKDILRLCLQYDLSSISKLDSINLRLGGLEYEY